MKSDNKQLEIKTTNQKLQITENENKEFAKLVVVKPVGYPFEFNLMDGEIEITNTKLFEEYARDQWLGLVVREKSHLFDQKIIPDYGFEIVTAKPNNSIITENTKIKIITDEIEGYHFELGKGVVLRDGSDVTIIANGINVPMALNAAKTLEAEGISARVIDMHTIKPLDEELVVKAARETGCIVTSEEHSVIGGLGGAVCELLSERCPVPVVRHGVEDSFGRSGTYTAVLEYYGITPEGIAEKARKAVALKKG